MSKPVLFIDRDGTLIHEPEDTEQIDSLDRLEILPGAAEALAAICAAKPYRLVIVTNQDGLGSPSFPEENFWPAQNEMLKIFKKSGVQFDDVLIDRSFASQNAPTRKPRTGLMGIYLDGSCDMKKSWVIGDRLTDMEFAKNLGCSGIWFSRNTEKMNRTPVPEALEPVIKLRTSDWKQIQKFLTK